MKTKLICSSNSCKNSLAVDLPMEKLLDASKADQAEAMINHPKTMSSRGNEDQLVQPRPGKSGKTVDSNLAMLLPRDLRHLGLEIDLVAMAVARILITEVLATMPLPLPIQLRGLSRLQATQLPLHTQDFQPLATLAAINHKEPHPALQPLLD